MTRALVLGGGGIAGIAWETGLLLGLRDAGVDVTDADRVIGSSAGACVGAQVTTGCDLDELFERQLAPPPQVAVQGEPKTDLAAMFARLGEIFAGPQPLGERLAALGAFALENPTSAEPARREEIAARLPVHRWPDRDLRVTAIDTANGVLRVFTPDDAEDVDLVDAVAASCAVPGVRPPVTIGSTRYMDGGVRTTTNADLATGCDVVLVVAPFADQPTRDPELVAAKEELHRTSTVLTILPDEVAVAAMGINPLDLSTAKPCALAGRAQAAAHVAEVSALWDKGR